ncbi:MAG: membrane protein insertion efficiency factor YidD [Candidatus Margulisiibacteriota bacterium]
MTWVVQYLLKRYQKLNLFPFHCRYYPTCSCYADQAIERHGLAKGIFLALKRLIKCNQLFPGGFDPVP